MKIINKRSNLARLKRAIENENLTIGILGGSISGGEENVGGFESNWPTFLRGWFLSSYPKVHLTVNNAGIGGTGALSGLMRCQKELIDTKCDIVFVEYAVNDCYGDSEKRQREREGLLRKLLKNGVDVVLVYTYRVEMHEAMANGKMPEVIKEFETLAERYKISSVWSGLYALNQLNSGRISWEMWLPISGGTLHPDYLGSMIYSEPVIEYLKSEINDNITSNETIDTELPTALNANNYESIKAIEMKEWKFASPWCVMKELKFPWYDKVLYTCANGAELSFNFKGRALMTHLNFGKRCGVIKFQIDDMEWKTLNVDRASWVPDKDWCCPVLMESDLVNKEHSCKIKTCFENIADCKGSECKIFTFMAVE